MSNLSIMNMKTMLNMGCLSFPVNSDYDRVLAQLERIGIVSKNKYNQFKLIAKAKTCYVKRGGVATQRVYDIVGKDRYYYILKCEVTGGTRRLRLADIKLLQAVS